MRTMILVAVLALAAPAWAQAPAEKTQAAKVAAPNAKVTKATVKFTAKRHQDARHCLQRPNNDAIIRCAEEYL